jgi:hypothetical protein
VIPNENLTATWPSPATTNQHSAVRSGLARRRFALASRRTQHRPRGNARPLVHSPCLRPARSHSRCGSSASRSQVVHRGQQRPRTGSGQHTRSPPSSRHVSAAAGHGAPPTGGGPKACSSANRQIRQRQPSAIGVPQDRQAPSCGNGVAAGRQERDSDPIESIRTRVRVRLNGSRGWNTPGLGVGPPGGPSWGRRQSENDLDGPEAQRTTPGPSLGEGGRAAYTPPEGDADGRQRENRSAKPAGGCPLVQLLAEGGNARGELGYDHGRR